MMHTLVKAEYADGHRIELTFDDGRAGVLEWEDGPDIAPETLYAKATGEPLPDWMEAE